LASDLLPTNATDLEKSLAGAASIINDIPLDIASLWNPATCPAPLLPWLAWALSADVWSATWSDATKREYLAHAIEDQRRKGTPASVQSVLASFDSLLYIVEWFQQNPHADPYTFEVMLPLIDGTGVAGGPRVTATFAREIVAAVNMAKPVRAHFELVQTLATIAAAIPVAAADTMIYARLPRAGTDADGSVPWTDLLQDENGEPLTDDSGGFLDGTA
jgi:phage tail P2-like protein